MNIPNNYPWMALFYQPAEQHLGEVNCTFVMNLPAGCLIRHITVINHATGTHDTDGVPSIVEDQVQTMEFVPGMWYDPNSDEFTTNQYIGGEVIKEGKDAGNER